MTWLNLSVTLTEGGKRLEALLQQLKLRQQERERLQADVVPAVREELKPREGSDPRDKRRRIEPIGTIPQRDGFSVAWLRYFTAGNSPSYRLYSTDGSSFVDFNLDEGYLIPQPAGWGVPSESFGTAGPSNNWWVEGTGDNGEIFMGTSRFNPIRNYGGSTSGIHQLVLPAGGDGMIVVFRARSWAAQTRASSDYTSVTTRHCEVWPDSVLTLCTTDTTYTITQMPRSDHLLHSGEQARAFYVTRSTVAEVAVPAGLRFYSDKPDDGAGREFVPGDNLIVAIQGQFINQRIDTRQTFRGEGRYAADLNAPELMAGIRYHDNNTIGPIVANGLVDFGAEPFQSQGLLREPRFGTPAALAYLASGGDEMVGHFDYADVPIGFPMPPAYYSAEYEEADQSGVLNIKKTPIRPTTIDQVIDTSGVTPRLAIPLPQFADGWDGQTSGTSLLTPLVAWDYGQPFLCRALLNEIGLTP